VTDTTGSWSSQQLEVLSSAVLLTTILWCTLESNADGACAGERAAPL
jgi:hypothetical protein